MIVCICGKTFFPPKRKRGLTKKYCSQRCNTQAWRSRHPDRKAALQAKQNEKRRQEKTVNPEKFKAREAARYAADPSAHRARVAAYRRANPDKVAAYRRSRPEKNRAYSTAYRARNPEKVAAYRAKYGAMYPERQRAASKRWKLAHPEKVHQHIATRRARRHGNGGSHTLAEWQQLCDLWASCCAYCGEAKKLTRDHKLPLSRGGTDDITNLVPACRSCNSKKMTQTAPEFLARRIA